MLVREKDISNWAGYHDARGKLPILVRRLIRETTPTLLSMRFPGNEAVDLPGHDGQAEVENRTKWVSSEKSIWEMGCNEDSQAKADADYEKRTAKIPEDERKNSSFVFVTPRRWRDKDKWQKDRRQEGSWADVRAYDAADLETWLEEAPVTSRWLAELLGKATPDLLTPHEWWQQWSTASNPPIPTRLVAARRHDEADALLKKLQKREQVVTIQADNRQEAVAFVVAALVEAKALDLLDLTLVANSAGTRIPASETHLIVIDNAPEGQGPEFADRHNITIVRTYFKGHPSIQDPLELSHVPSEVFHSELERMGLPEDEAKEMALQTGHSVPILRRRLSSDPEVKTPIWAQDRASAKWLIPFALAGSWMERPEVLAIAANHPELRLIIEDLTVIELLGDLNERETKRIRDELLKLDDAPIARYGNVNVVVSQLDALFAVGPYIERDEIERFFDLVPALLKERDPALDLPQDQRWMANALGKGRNYSDNFLSGLGNALCILAVHGNEICGKRLRIDLAGRAEQVVQSLMQDADEERWLTIRGHLRMLAEASPKAFLDCLETELQRPEPAIRTIMGSTDGLVSGDCLRTDLLWALEILAWHQKHFSRVARIVFDLQRFEVKDNWTNTPTSVAQALFRAWLPATSLNVEERSCILRDLSEKFRVPAMDVCISLLPSGLGGFATKTLRPEWRALEREVPVPTRGDVSKAMTEASRLLLDLAPFDKAELQKLLEIAVRLHPDDLNRLVKEIERWAADASDDEKAELRDHIRRRHVLHAFKSKIAPEGVDVRLQKMTSVLEPRTVEARHRWLFDNHAIEWSTLIEDEEGKNISYEERAKQVHQWRTTALEEIRDQLGEDQILPFALSVKHPRIVALTLISPKTPPEEAAKWIERVLKQEQSEAANAFLRESLWRATLNNLGAVFSILRKNGVLDNDSVKHRVAEHLPGVASGWGVAEELGDDFTATYWNTVSIQFFDDTPPEEMEVTVERLLNAKRPCAAFLAIRFLSDRVAPEQWVRILQAIARGDEPDGVAPESYYLNKVFEHLDNADDITDQQIAYLELPFISLLRRYGEPEQGDQRILAVHRELARNPEFFVELLSLRYRRKDRKDDPEQAKIPEDRQKLLSDLAYHTLDDWDAVPGLSEEGEIDREHFNSWAERALKRAEEMDRKEVAESHFADLLACFARPRSWDNWLPSVILDFLDRPENGGLRRGFITGVFNARGITVRGPYDGGEQERELAGQYRELSTRYENSHPRVSEMLISIAEGYDRDARQHDERAEMGERWNLN